MNTRLQDKIDQYHAGRMSAKEVSSFEKELASDPSLQAESDFQSDIIDGLKEYRRAELKARLNTVDVGPAWFDFVQQSTLLKSFGGVALATLVGTGVFLLAEPKLDPVAADVVVDSPKEVLAQFSWNIEPASLAEISSTIRVKPQNVRIISEEIAEPVENTTSKEITVVERDAAETQSFSPNFDAPSAEEVADEEVMEVSSLDELPESTSDMDANEPIDVDYESKKTLDIKYKYYDGKLFLSGDFDRAPYEILEINSADGRRIYVKYLDKFYKVNVTDRLTPLPQVQNVNVIKELQLLRENK